MDAQTFEQHLSSCGQKYELLSSPGGNDCHIRFTGLFLGELIIWDAYLQTLSYYVSKLAQPTAPVRQFINVGEDSELGRIIRIGLNVPAIDEPVILKTLIMVRQYKRLKLGRYEYGELLHI